MRPVRSLAIYLAAVFIGGGLLAPWLYFAAQRFAPHSSLAGQPFHRFVDRSLLGIALLGLWPLLGAVGMRSWRELGFVSIKGRRTELAGGFSAGWAALLAAFLPAILCGARVAVFQRHPVSYFAGTIATALLVGLLEELLFRGALFGLLRRAMNWPAAALWSSVIYALAHFLKKADVPGPVTWRSGWQLLPLMARELVDWHTVIPALFNLTLIGFALALAYQRTRALYASIALHASLIFWLRFFQFLTQPAPGAKTWLWGGDNPLNGWLAVPVLAGLVCAVARLTAPKSNA